MNVREILFLCIELCIKHGICFQYELNANFMEGFPICSVIAHDLVTFTVNLTIC